MSSTDAHHFTQDLGVEELARPSEEAVAKNTEKTRAALQALMTGVISHILSINSITSLLPIFFRMLTTTALSR